MKVNCNEIYNTAWNYGSISIHLPECPVVHVQLFQVFVFFPTEPPMYIHCVWRAFGGCRPKVGPKGTRPGAGTGAGTICSDSSEQREFTCQGCCS